MWRIPRLAVGTVQPGARCEPLFWALLTALSQAGVCVQAFGSQAAFATHDAARKLTGRPRRYLDAWLMDADQSLCAFQRGVSECHLGLIEGTFGAAEVS